MSEVGVSEEGVCCKMVFLFQDVKFKDPKFKHENFITIHAIKIGFQKYYILPGK